MPLVLSSHYNPNPTSLPAVRGDRAGTASHRNVFCDSYQSCLNVAVKRGWADWTCAKCTLVTLTPIPSAVKYAQDRPRE